MNKPALKKPSFGALFFRLTNQEKILFAKRLSILVKAGVPILECLRILKKQSTSPSAKKIFEQVVEDVENGQFLSTSLGQFHKIFGDLAVHIIRVGEMSGTLQENLNYLADELEKKQALRRKVVSAMVYPAIIVLGTIVISVMLTVFIFPKILPIFASFKFDLPITTKILIFVSGVFIHYGFLLLLGLVGVVVVAVLLSKSDNIKFAFEHFVFKVPIFGRLSQSYHMANFCRTLGLLLKSQIVIVQATTITADTMNTVVYRREIHSISESLKKGGRISTHLDSKPNLFPPMVSQMVSVGETTGNLSETLYFVSEMYESEVDMITKNLSTSIEPILMIFMGAIVGFIAVSIITPIYEITQHLHP